MWRGCERSARCQRREKQILRRAEIALAPFVPQGGQDDNPHRIVKGAHRGGGRYKGKCNCAGRTHSPATLWQAQRKKAAATWDEAKATRTVTGYEYLVMGLPGRVKIVSQ